MIDKKKIRSRIKTLPNSPGVYKYINSREKVLYIGKAIDIKQRVSSYFTGNQSYKIQRLVSQIFEIKYFVVDTEFDALLLENNLIKKHQPKYNVLLKDGKTYPFLCIKKEVFPRVFLTRKVIKDNSHYFGPYASTKLVRTLLEFIHQLYPLRTCSLNLNQENISNNKFKLCLEYHIGNCLAPCEGKQTEEDYLIGIENIKKILSGDLKSVLSFFKKKMHFHASNLDYEKAKLFKDKLTLLNNYQSKSTIVNPKINNVDVFTIVSDKDLAYVNYLKIFSGSIIQTHSIEITKKLDETDEDLLTYSIIDIRHRFKSNSKFIYSSIHISNPFDNVQLIIPKIGDKYKLIELSKRNAFQMRLDKMKQREINKNQNKNKILFNVQRDLSLSMLPRHIECFDNSNLQGTNPVSACVVFKDGKPSKYDYRHFKIKNVIGPDDFASMEEVIFRRYKRLLDEKSLLPQLIVIDGGKGQLSAAVKSLKKLNLLTTINIISIAKKLEEIFIYNDPLPIFLDKRSSTLKLIQRLRDEAHRFSLSHHRSIRSSNMLESELDNIKGIGEKTINLLISHFGSVKNLRKADKSEIINLVGNHKAQKIIISLHND